MTTFKRPLALSLLTSAIAVGALLSSCNQQEPQQHAKIDPADILTTAEAMDAASPADWRDVNPENTVYMELESGRVVMELAPGFAPNHVKNLKTLIRQNHFDGAAVVRSQENYVAQWSNPDETIDLGNAKANLEPEWEMDWDSNLPFLELEDGDLYAPIAGISSGFPVAGNKSKNRIWLTHCYGMLGVGRGNELDSGNSAELYVVTGHAPRHLDKNVTLIGRVIEGMSHLTTLPRGTDPLGFYESEEEYAPITSMRLAADVPANDRSDLQIMRTDSKAYANFVQARRYRKEDWFDAPTGRIELCNVPIPVRVKP